MIAEFMNLPKNYRKMLGVAEKSRIFFYQKVHLALLCCTMEWMA